MLAIMGAVVAGVILVIVRATSAPHHPYPPVPMPPGPTNRETPLEILARRFASGEISAEEYQKARDLLSR